MKVTIVCESMFGNTEYLAEQVLAGLTEVGATVSLVDVGDAVTADFDDLDLLIVAAPTHALSLSRPESRADAVERGAEPRRALIGVREWLEDIDVYLPATTKRPPVAVFDTMVLKARHWPRSAASGAARRLRRAGFHVVDRTSFYVEGTTGPLVDGEGVRAWTWGNELPGSLNRAPGSDARSSTLRRRRG